jgi:SAM-dependent methyltransferase
MVKAPNGRGAQLGRARGLERGLRTTRNYSSFASVYDFLVERPATDLIFFAFLKSIQRFGIRFESIADVGCGTGRFLAKLASRPVEMVGIDNSPAVLAMARRRLASRAARFLHQDMRRLSLPRPVDVITCNNQTLNYMLARRDLAQAFRTIARGLRRRGIFIFDFLARLLADRRVQPRVLRERIALPDYVIKFDACVDASRGDTVVTIAMQGPEGRAIEVHRQRWFRPSTIKELLADTGFRLLEMRPVDRQNQAWLHVVAQRL